MLTDSGEVISEHAEVPCLPPKQRAEWLGEDKKKILSFHGCQVIEEKGIEPYHYL